MKKFFIASVIGIQILFAVLATEAELTVKQSLSGNSAYLTLKKNKVSFSLSESLNKGGQLSIEPSPFFSLEIKDKLKIGNLVPSGIWKLVLGSDAGENLVSDFRKKSTLAATVPTAESKTNGLFFQKGNIEVFATSPFLFSSTPNSLGLNMRDENVFLVLYVYDNKEDPEFREMQVDWNKESPGKTGTTAVVGFNNDARLKKGKVETSAYVRFNKDLTLKTKLETGYGLRFSNGNLDIKINSSASTNKEYFSSVFQGYSDIFSFYIRFRDILKPEPIYGGTLQEKKTELEAELKSDLIEINSLSSLEYKGKGTKTFYLEDTVKLFINQVSLEGKIKLSSSKESTDIKDYKLTLSAENGEISWEKDKISLMLVFESQIYKAGKIKVSIDQSRIVSMTLKSTF